MPPQVTVQRTERNAALLAIRDSCHTARLVLFQHLLDLFRATPTCHDCYLSRLRQYRSRGFPLTLTFIAAARDLPTTKPRLQELFPGRKDRFYVVTDFVAA